jgi:solute:Na+ symporter, SSS family
VQFLYGTGIMLVISLSLFIGISLATEAPSAEDLEGLTWSKATWKQESEDLEGTPWYLNYRYMGAVLFIGTIALIIPFI